MHNSASATSKPIVIIGSGIGGLTLGARLARKGRKVVVLEQHRRHGGYATTFVRKRIEFEVSLHMIGDLAEGCRLRSVLEELGVWQTVEFLRSSSLYKASLPGVEIDICGDAYGGYLERLCGLYPEESRGLTAFFARLRDIRRDIDRISEAQAKQGLPDLRALAPILFDALELTLADAFQDYGFSQPVCAILSQLWMYHGLPPSRLSLAQFAAVWAEYHLHGGWYPRGHSQAISDAMKKAIEDCGGHVRTRATVRRVLIERGRAVGVELDTGETIGASVVVANTDPFQAFFELVGREHLPRRLIKRLEKMEPSCSALQMFLLIDCDMRARFQEHSHEVIVNTSLDIEAAYNQSLDGDVEQAPYILTIFDNVLQPPRGSELNTLSVFLLASSETWEGLPKEEYRARKQRVQRVLIDRLDSRYPGIRNHIRYSEVSTPRTNTRYTSNKSGAIYGLAPTVGQSVFRRMSHRTPIEDFWLVGAWTQPSGGYSGSMWSGYNLASRLLQSESATKLTV